MVDVDLIGEAFLFQVSEFDGERKATPFEHSANILDPVRNS